MFEIFNETDEKIEQELKTVEKLLEFAIKEQKLDEVHFNIIIVDNEYIHKINKEYRQIDRETDVISFALEDNEEMINPELRILGDIYISIDKAKSQAIEYGHSFLRELCFLTIHGFLHLLGYDHMTEIDEQEMFQRQEAILDEFGIKRETD